MQQRGINHIPMLLENIVSNTEIESEIKAEMIKEAISKFDKSEENPNEIYLLDGHARRDMLQCVILAIALSLKQDLKETLRSWEECISPSIDADMEMTWATGFSYIINHFLKSAATKIIIDTDEKGNAETQEQYEDVLNIFASISATFEFLQCEAITRLEEYVEFEKYVLAYKHVIELARKANSSPTEKTILKETINIFGELVKLFPGGNYPAANYVRKKVFQCYVMNISICGNYDLIKQKESWNDFIKAKKNFTWKDGYQYIIDQYIKRNWNTFHAYNKDLSLTDKEITELSIGIESILSTAIYLTMYYHKQEEYHEFYAEVKKYDRILTSWRDEKLNAQLNIKVDTELNFETLEELPNKNELTISRTKIAIQTLMRQCYQDMQNKPDSIHLCTVKMATYLSSYIMCVLYIQVDEDHKKNLMKYYSQSRIHFYRKSLEPGNKRYDYSNRFEQSRKKLDERKKATDRKQTLIELNIDDLYGVLSNHIMEIYKQSFPMLENAQAIQYINEIQNTIDYVMINNMENIILINLQNKLSSELSSLALKCEYMYKFYNESVDLIDAVKRSKVDLLEAIEGLEKHINEIHKEKLYIICAYFHCAVARAYYALNEEGGLYKEKVIVNYNKAKEYVPNLSPQISKLYCADINIFEIHTELQAIISNINKIVKENNQQKNKNKTINILNESLSLNIIEYLQPVLGNQFGIIISKNTYIHAESAQHGFLKYLREKLESLIRYGYAKEVVNCCCALQQLFSATELKHFTDICNIFTSELYLIKMRAIRELYEKDRSKPLPIYKPGLQYLTGAIYLKDHGQSQYDCTQDEYLEHVVFSLIRDNEKISAKIVNDYLELGLRVFPNNVVLNHKKASIEVNKFANQILEFKKLGVLSEVNLSEALNESAEKIKRMKIPALPEMGNVNKNINDEFKKLSTMHSEIEKICKLIVGKQDEIEGMIKQYQETLPNLNDNIKYHLSTSFTEFVFTHCDDKHIDIGKNVYSGEDNDLLGIDLEAIQKNRKIFSQLTLNFNRYKIINQSIKHDIEQYETLMSDFEVGIKRIDSLISDMNIKAKLETEKAKVVKEEKARKMEVEMVRKSEEKARRLEAERVKKAEVERLRLQTERAKKAEVERLRLQTETAKKAKVERMRLQTERAKKAEVERLRLEAEKVQKAEVERLRLEAEKVKRAEEERLKLEAEKVKRAEDERLRLEAEKVKRAEDERLRLEIEKVRRAEDEARRDNILLNGAGVSISTNILDILSEIDLLLRKIGSCLIFKSSLTTRFSIYCFNENPETAAQFTVNDIDVYIPYNTNVNISEIISIISQYKFIECISYSDKYRQFILEINGINIELTLITDATYLSEEFLIIRMGKMEFDYNSNKNNCISSDTENKIYIKASMHNFVIILPQEYKNEYINACKFKEFSLLAPSTKFKSYLYGIYKYTEKLKIDPCDSEFNFGINANTYPSPKVIYYDELLIRLVSYFIYLKMIDSFSASYFEMNEFIKKGIKPESVKLAYPLIKAFYYALIQSGECIYYRELTYDELSKISGNCSSRFIERCQILNQEMNKYYDIEDIVKKIAYENMNEFLIKSDPNINGARQYNATGNVPQYNVNNANYFYNSNGLNINVYNININVQQQYQSQNNKPKNNTAKNSVPTKNRQQNNTASNRQYQNTNQQTLYKPKNVLNQRQISNQQQNEPYEHMNAGL